MCSLHSARLISCLLAVVIGVATLAAGPLQDAVPARDAVEAVAEAGVGNGAPAVWLADEAELVGDHATPRNAVAWRQLLMPADDPPERALPSGSVALLLVAGWVLARPGLVRRLRAEDIGGERRFAAAPFCPG